MAFAQVFVIGAASMVTLEILLKEHSLTQFRVKLRPLTTGLIYWNNIAR